jgi:hypothetical protein
MDILILLLPILIEIIEHCVEKYGEEAVFARIRKRGALVQWRVYAAARKNGCDRKCAIEHARDAYDALGEMTDDEIRELIAEAKNG